MTDQAKRYNSKVLLFGEYTLMDGSAAIAIPFDKYSGQWKFDKTKGNKAGLQRLKKYLAQLYYQSKVDGVDFDQFEMDLASGLIFDSSVPSGYGLGSSGALTAAFFDQYIKKDKQYDLKMLKDILALIESCFHGASSGIDPLVSFLNLPLLIHPDSDIEILNIDRKDFLKNLHIIDTGMPRQTAPLVEAYKSTRSASAEFTMATDQIADVVNLVITAYVLGEEEEYISQLKELSRLQLETLTMLIPEPFAKLWKAGLEADTYYMKLCGAGGGGCLLAHFQDPTVASTFDKFKTLPVV